MEPFEAIELCDEILETLLPDLPDQASDFAVSVEDKVTDMRDWILERDHVTDRQADALLNMKFGCERWLNSDKL